MWKMRKKNGVVSCFFGLGFGRNLRFISVNLDSLGNVRLTNDDDSWACNASGYMVRSRDVGWLLAIERVCLRLLVCLDL
jgi:hypothetical protein